MKNKLGIFFLLFALPAGLYAAIVYQGGGKAPPAKPAARRAAAHVTVPASELQWTPFFFGLERAVISGDLSKNEPFVMRLRTTKSAAVPAHWHPMDEHITVLAGTLKVGAGDKYDPKSLHAITAGSYSFVPKDMRHFAWQAPNSVIQIHGVGPFGFTFVNPDEDPRKAAGK